jgi:hypothetical protein
MTGKRKLYAASVLLLLVSALLVGGKIDGDQYVQIIEWLMIAFAGANSAEHLSKGFKRE